MNLSEGKINKILLGIGVLALITLSFLATTSSTPYKTTNTVFSANRIIGPQATQTPQQISTKNYLDFSQRARKKISTGIIGNKITRYNVYVKNQDYIGGYFSVKFYFTDYYNREYTETLTKYIASKQEERFFYQNINKENEIKSWSYEVLSNTKQPL